MPVAVAVAVVAVVAVVVVKLLCCGSCECTCSCYCSWHFMTSQANGAVNVVVNAFYRVVSIGVFQRC